MALTNGPLHHKTQSRGTIEIDIDYIKVSDSVVIKANVNGSYLYVIIDSHKCPFHLRTHSQHI